MSVRWHKLSRKEFIKRKYDEKHLISLSLNEWLRQQNMFAIRLWIVTRRKRPHSGALHSTVSSVLASQPLPRVRTMNEQQTNTVGCSRIRVLLSTGLKGTRKSAAVARSHEGRTVWQSAKWRVLGSHSLYWHQSLGPPRNYHKNTKPRYIRTYGKKNEQK